MNVSILQLDQVWHDRDANHRQARELLAANRPAPGALVVLPEAFPVGFSMEVDAIADREGRTTQFVCDLAKEFGVTVIAGNIVKPDDRGRNQALIAGPDGALIDTYEKLHPFSFAKEDAHYRGGSKLVRFENQGAKLTPFICYDLRFPEAFRIAAKAGVDVFVVIANWPAARVNHWLALLIARAIENQAYVVACNRVGRDPNVEYPGRSIVIDPRGNIVADAGDREGVLTATLDLDALRAYRKSFPALADMRFVRQSI